MYTECLASTEKKEVKCCSHKGAMQSKVAIDSGWSGVEGKELSFSLIRRYLNHRNVLGEIEVEKATY